jgi:hypothetical protein
MRPGLRLKNAGAQSAFARFGVKREARSRRQVRLCEWWVPRSGFRSSERPRWFGILEQQHARQFRLLDL